MTIFEIALRHLVLGLTVLTALLLLFLLANLSQLRRERAGRLLLLFGVLVLPVATALAAFSQNMERATETSFCMSCHEMQRYGQSLRIDDSEVIMANHFQNRLIPREHACYTCHTDYTLFGGAKAKMTGLKHVWVHYVRGVPETIELYGQYRNHNCLHCHDGMRKFEESKHHNTSEAPLARIKAGEKSCISDGCHDTGHMVDELEDLDFWKRKEEAR